MRTQHDSILCLPIHGLGIEIIILLFVLQQPSVLLEFLKLLGGAVIHPRIIFTCPLRKIDFWFDNMVKRFLIVSGFSTRLFRIENVIWSAFHLLHQILRWAQTSKRLNFRHVFLRFTRQRYCISLPQQHIGIHLRYATKIFSQKTRCRLPV